MDDQQITAPKKETQICPYPGLRSFNEQESLYFKGREGQVEEVSQKLQENKFVLVTGASGDGKSSLVFAGLIPNCKAGFFRSSYNNWVITSFRPERSPLANLSEVLAPHLGYSSKEALEKEWGAKFS